MIQPPRNNRGVLVFTTKLRRKVEFALRTAWTTFLCLLLMIFWKWSSIAIHVSAVLSIISSVLYFGWWMMNFYKVIIATIVGGGMGIIIGYCYEIKPFQLVLFFIASLWINKMPGWDRSSMVLGTLAMILGSVWPNLTEGRVFGRKSFLSILAIQLVPYLITGVSLLFPKPGLAVYAARAQVVVVCRKLSLMTSSTVNAFKSYDYLDLHCAEFDQWLTDVRGELALLRQLKVYIDYEKMIFWNVKDFPAALSIFIDIAELLIQELIGLQTMVKSITYNHTQEIFVELLTPVLVDMNEEMEIALTIVGEYFETFHPFPDAVLACKTLLSRILHRVCGNRFSRFLSQRGKIKSFYDVPNSKDLIEMHRLHYHEDLFDNNDDAIEENNNEINSSQLVNESTIIDGRSNSSSRVSSSKARDRSLTDLHGFHHYHFTEDVETGKDHSTSGTKVETDTTASHTRQSHDTSDISQINDTINLHQERPVEVGDEKEEVEDAKSTPASMDAAEERIRLFDECIERLCRARAQLLYSFNEVRRKYVFGSIDGETAGPYGDHTISSLFQADPTDTATSSKMRSEHQDTAKSTQQVAASPSGASSPPSLQLPSEIASTRATSTTPQKLSTTKRRRGGNDTKKSMPSAAASPSSIKPFTISQKYELEVQLANEIFDLDPHRQLVRSAQVEQQQHQQYQKAYDRNNDSEQEIGFLQENQDNASDDDDDDDDDDGLLAEDYEKSAEEFDSSFNKPEISIFTSDPRKKRFLILATREENIRLSLRNLGPRASYMHRMSILVEYASSLRMVFKEQSRPFSWYQFIFSNIKFLWEYFMMLALFWWSVISCITVVVVRAVTCRLKYTETKKILLKDLSLFIEQNAQACKISAATTLGISLRIFELMPGFYQGGLWVALVMALIRQDNSASSFLTGYQRLEGTVIGAIFSVLLSQIFACSTHSCGDTLFVPAITIWVTICAFFREGPQHGYSAVVAAFTPIILLLGSETSLNSAWGRIIENFIGIAIYLTIDNLILPKRTYPLIKILVLKGIDETRVMFSESVKAVEELIGPRVLDYMTQHAVELRSQRSHHHDGGLDDNDQAQAQDGVAIPETEVTKETLSSSPITAKPATSDSSADPSRIVRVNSASNASTVSEVVASPGAPVISGTTHVPAAGNRRRTLTSEVQPPPASPQPQLQPQSPSTLPAAAATSMLLGMYGSSTDVRRRALSCVSNTSSSSPVPTVTGTNAGMQQQQQQKTNQINAAANNSATNHNTTYYNSSADPQHQLSGYLHSGYDEPEIRLDAYYHHSHPRALENQFKIVSASSPYSRIPPLISSTSSNQQAATSPGDNSNDISHNEQLTKDENRPEELIDINDEDSDIMKNRFIKCTSHLNNAEQQLHTLQGQLATQATLLSMVVYEPEIFHRPFPLPAYQRLYQAFIRVHRSAVALNSGSRAFAVIFKQMMRNHENVGPYLKNFTYMSKHMFIAAAKAEVALRSALDALSMVYDQRDFHAELTSLLTLRRVCDRLIQSVDEHFRTKYLRQSVDVLTKFNPYFIVAWQNVFEATTDMIHDLSELGMALLIVRNAEALSYV